MRLADHPYLAFSAALLACWWLALSALTASAVRDSLARTGRRFDRADVLLILSGPLFWLSCLMEATREARCATSIAQSDPVKPDYQPGDEIAVFTPSNEAA